MRISDWSSDVCSSDLLAVHQVLAVEDLLHALGKGVQHGGVVVQIARLHELDLRVAGGDDIGVVVDALHQDAGEEELGKHAEALVAEPRRMPHPAPAPRTGDAGAPSPPPSAHKYPPPQPHPT